MKVDLNDPAETGKVISIEVARRSMHFKTKECEHMRISVDTVEAQLTCQDCGTKIDAIGWIVMMAEHWAWVRELTRRYNEARAKFDAKQRCRCEHCNKITSVRPAPAAEVREYKRAIRQDEGRKL